MSTTDRPASDSSDPTVSSERNASSVRSTISRKKLAANRRNARKSTGPHSDEGRAVSSRNAVTHGIFCNDLVIGGEQMDVMLALRNTIHLALGVNPNDAIELGLADSIVSARWKQRRVRGAERDLHESSVGQWRDSLRERLAGHARRTEAACEQSWDEADEERIRAEADQQRRTLESLRDGPDPLPSSTMAGDFAGGGEGAWERLGRYEQRLEQTIARSMRELRAYRKELREHGRAGPDTLLDTLAGAIAEAEAQARLRGGDDDDDDDADAGHAGDLAEAQNEPTAEETAASDDAVGGCDSLSCGTGAAPVQVEERGDAPALRKGERTRENPPPDRAE